MKKYIKLSVVLLILVGFLGCGNFNVTTTNNDKGIIIKKSKNTYTIVGKTSVQPLTEVGIHFGIKKPLDKTFSVSYKVLLKKEAFSNDTLVLKTNDNQYYSFGSRVGTVYLAIFDSKAIFDELHKRSCFGDEASNFHEIKVVYTPVDRTIRSYVDGTLFGQLDTKSFSPASNMFTKCSLYYGTAKGISSEVEVIFKDIKIE